MHAVLDTNIVIDLLHFADPRARTLREAIDRGKLTCFTDQPCLAELERVAAYPQFALDDDAREALLANYRHFVGVCEADGPEDYALPRCRDADDQKFLILAARCRADLLVTRDRQLLRLARQRNPAPPYAILDAETAGALFTSR